MGGGCIGAQRGAGFGFFLGSPCSYSSSPIWEIVKSSGKSGRKLTQAVVGQSMTKNKKSSEKSSAGDSIIEN
jgi:hypothetical protein